MRAVNRIGAGVLGLLLVVAGVAVVVEAALVVSGRPPWLLPLDRWFARWEQTTVGATWVFWVSVGVGVLGLLILLAQVRRWRPDRVPAGEGPRTGWWLGRRSVQRRAAVAAAGVTGVRDVRARLRGGRRLTVEARAIPERYDAVRESVREELDRLTVASTMDVKVVLREPVRRVA